MQIVVRANDDQREEWLLKKTAPNLEILWINADQTLTAYQADAYFDLLFDEENINNNTYINNKPVFANAVIITCKKLPINYFRINAWNGFLKRDTIEITVTDFNSRDAHIIMDALGWKYSLVADIPGMIAPRILSMIINEAYFGLGDDISTKEEIDIAMKLGTNYPFGPFEWGKKIGLKKIYHLLKKLSEQNIRYAIAPSLEAEINEGTNL